MAKHAIALPALALTALLIAGCGSDLDSRNEAAMEGRPPSGEVTIRQEARSSSDTPRSAEGQANASTFSDEDDGAGQQDDDGDDILVDADPDSLIDTTAGFAPEPMDDASGFDPTPTSEDDWGETE